EPLSRYSREELERWHALFMEEKIEPFILPRAIELVRRHEQAGDTTLIITATNRFVAGPIGRRYGIDIMLASECEEIDGRYTGKPCDIPCFREGKITRLQRWLEETGHDLKGAYFYSDSRNDLPLLSLVDNPAAVDPDDVLLAHAREHGWPVISLRDRADCRVRSRKPRSGWRAPARRQLRGRDPARSNRNTSSDRQYAAEERLDVAGLGNRRMYRVVGALEAPFGDDQVTVQVAAGRQQHVAQAVFGQMHGAGGRDQNPIAVEQAHGLFVQTTVGSLAIADILALLDEGRWIGDDDVELLPGTLELAQGVHDIPLDHAHAFGNTVEFGIVLDQIQRRRRAVDTHHLTGTEGRRLHTPAADIAVQIQYPLAGDIGRQARPVHAVVIEP